MKTNIGSLFNGKRCLNFGISLIFTSILCVQAVKAQSRLYFSDNICDKNKSLTVSVEPVHEILFLLTKSQHLTLRLA